MIGADILADTNALIAWINRDEDLAPELLSHGKPATSLITLAELYFGALKSTRTERNRARIESFRKSITVVLPTERTAELYAEVRIKLHRKGRPIPANDIWIAAIALEHNLALLTPDAHFQHVEGLRVVSW